MIKRSLLFLVTVLLMSSSILAQNWTKTGTIPAPPDTMNVNTGVQYLVVDPNDRIWVNPYATFNDTMFVPDSGIYKTVRSLYVYNPDGTLWKKIQSVTIDGKLWPFYGSGYGLAKDQDGNIIRSQYGNFYRINYNTGEGMTVGENIFDGNSVCSPSVDAQGLVYAAAVLPGFPVKVLNPDFTFKENAVDTVNDYGRYVEVSKDGLTIYVPRFTGPVLRFRRASEFDAYSKDTILVGAAVESGAWDNVDPTKIWFSVGNPLTPPSGTFAGRDDSYLVFDTTTWAFTDSIKWVYSAPGADERARGIAFSLDGTKAYITEFGLSEPYPVQVHSNPNHTVGIQKDENTVVENYSLGQNYPNPFNPTTEIKFSVVNSGLVTLKVYDLLGKEVASLVNENLNNGSYTVSFNASKLASGTYVYRLSVNGTQISKKMMLMK